MKRLIKYIIEFFIGFICGFMGTKIAIMLGDIIDQKLWPEA